MDAYGMNMYNCSGPFFQNFSLNPLSPSLTVAQVSHTHPVAPLPPTRRSLRSPYPAARFARATPTALLASLAQPLPRCSLRSPYPAARFARATPTSCSLRSRNPYQLLASLAQPHRAPSSPRPSRQSHHTNLTHYTEVASLPLLLGEQRALPGLPATSPAWSVSQASAHHASPQSVRRASPTTLSFSSVQHRRYSHISPTSPRSLIARPSRQSVRTQLLARWDTGG